MVSRQDIQTLLTDGCRQLGMRIDGDQLAAFRRYLELLLEWGQSYNLTSLREPSEIVIKHYLDSLSIRQFITGSNTADVGSGAGFPGLPLAVMTPDHKFTLIDSNGKRCRFMTQVKIELGLGNVQVLHARSEQEQTLKFDQVVVRAYGDLPKIVASTAHLLGTGGQILAMKGSVDQQQLNAVRELGYDCSMNRLTVPFLNERRQLVSLVPM